MSEQERGFWITSGYGANTREPYIEVQLEDAKIQMPPEDARRLALNLLQAAEAALSDAFLVEFMQAEIGLERPQAANILVKYREWREGRREAGHD